VKVISLGGMLIESPGSHIHGATVSLVVELPGAPLYVRGRIVNIARREGDELASVGIEYLDLDDAERDQISRYLRRLETTKH
jgi:hypothetical protein